MDKLDKKTIDVSRGLTYTYYTSPAKNGLPTVFLIHGWPDSAELWSDVTTNWLQPNGYGVVAIDCLGYGGTSKPTDREAYNFQYMAQDCKEILDKEGLDKIVVLGHDWGSVLTARFWNFHPDRCAGVVFVNVAYMPPTDQPFDLDAVVQTTQQVFGYGLYWYWHFFASDEAPKVLNSRLESVWTIGHGLPESWRNTFCTPNGMRDFLVADRRQPTLPYATEEMKQAFIARMQRDKFDGPQNWYGAMVHGVQDEASKAVPKENYAISAPVLFFAGSDDVVCRPEAIQMPVDNGLLPKLTSVVVKAGHWSMLSNPREFGEALTSWLKANFA